MKFFKFMILACNLCVSLILISCQESSNPGPAIKRIINETQFNIEITGSNCGDTEISLYQLQALDTLDIQGNCYGPFEERCDLGWLGKGCEVVTINFDNARLQLFEGIPQDDLQRNINGDPGLGFYGYENTTLNGAEIYTYRITQEDYDNAEPIGG